ncbi:MAG: hypothetical protein Q9174_005653 [Haloplaca sp. 1 TL-2023]
MHYSILSTSTVVVSLLASSSQAFWRLSCGIIQSSRIDPIVNPGALSPHAHKIAGASSISQTSNFDSLLQSKCTSCEIQADKSAYWTPQLYYEHPNGSFEEVPNSGMTVYYLGRGDDKDLKPFPPGFRMVSGNTKARSYNENVLIPGSKRPVADRVSFACLHTSPSKEQPGMTQTDCKNGLRAQVHFQSCWNGKDLYKPDNSHVEYKSGLDNGVCPPTHPVSMMNLFFEVLYGVNDIKKDGGRFVFSQGDATGYGFHGDFMNGWEPQVLEAAVKECAFKNEGGAVKYCAPFQPSLDPKFSKTCPEVPSLLDEPIHGMLDKLPGCIKVTAGPEDATDADTACGAGDINAVLRPSSLNSTLSSAKNVTGAAVTTLTPKVSAVKAAKAPASTGNKAPKATSSAAPSVRDADEEEEIERRSVARPIPWLPKLRLPALLRRSAEADAKAGHGHPKWKLGGRSAEADAEAGHGHPKWKLGGRSAEADAEAGHGHPKWKLGGRSAEADAEAGHGHPKWKLRG